MSGAAAVQLLRVPYDSGHFEVRMGAGPSALARAGAADRLRARGHAVTETQLDPTSPWRAELRTAFEMLRRVADAASTAHGTGQVPLLLSGNCNSTVGMLGGLIRSSQRRVGLVWLDAHGDFNTPAIDPWGFLDGQGLAMAVGGCWQALTATVPGFIPLPEQRVVLVGARSLDDQEAPALRDSQVTWLPPARARHTETVRDAVHRLATESDIVHIHVDLDVHDPSIAPANGYAAPDGLTAEHVRAVVREVADQLPVSSATLASYDPAYDPAGRMRDTALDLLALVADLATPLAAARYL